MPGNLEIVRARVGKLECLVESLSDIYADEGVIDFAHALKGTCWPGDPTKMRHRVLAKAIYALWADLTAQERELKALEISAVPQSGPQSRKKARRA